MQVNRIFFGRGSIIHLQEFFLALYYIYASFLSGKEIDESFCSEHRESLDFEVLLKHEVEDEKFSRRVFTKTGKSICCSDRRTWDVLTYCEERR